MKKIFSYFSTIKVQVQIYKLLTYIATFISLSSIFLIIGYIVFKGIGHLKPHLFSWTYTSKNVSMTPSIINTIYIMIITLILALPVGIFSSIYLIEYSNKNNPFIFLVKLATQTLSGIPSIIYGLFGMLFFVKAFKFGLSIVSGSLSLAIIILPLIIKTTEEALLSVPFSYREASYGLGASKLQTVFKVILPLALPGIFSGVILSIGRIVGESAALIFTSGTIAKTASSIFDSGRSLAVHMYILAGEGMYINEASATSLILLLIALLVNVLSEIINYLLGAKTHESIRD